MTAVLSFLSRGWFTRQLVVDGLVTGMVYGLVAMGIVLVYRTTRVINFAVAGLGLVGAGLFALLVAQYGLPFWAAAAIGISCGCLFGAAVERIVIRRLFSAPRVIVLVATVGLAQLSLAVFIALPDIDEPAARFPVPIGSVYEFAGMRLAGPQVSILVLVPLVAIGLGWMLNRTSFGNTIKASAENADLALLSGINPRTVSTAVWAIAGGLATLALALLAGQSGAASDLDNLGPNTLVRALAAAVIAGMASFPRAFLAGTVLGIVQAVISFNFLDEPGLVDLLVLAAVLLAVHWQSRRGQGETQIFNFGYRAEPIPERLRGIWWLRHIDRLGLVAGGVAFALLPLVVTQPSRLLLHTSILAFAVCALSLTVLTGWGGQVSLGQMAFAGIGAMLTASFTRGLNVDIGWHETRLLVAGIEPLRFGPSLLLSALITAGLAALLGAGALRTRGLSLAVVTFAFGLAASSYLYDRPVLRGSFTQSIPLRRTELFGIDIASQRTYYYVVLSILGIATLVVARLRSSGVGRTTIAVRDNADRAAAYTVSPTRTKLRAFALAGALAAIGGSLLAANVQTVARDRYFTVADSLLLVAIAVIGGLGSVGGAVLGSLWVIGLPAFLPDSALAPVLTSSIGLLVLLLWMPGGLMQIPHRLRHALIARADRRGAPLADQIDFAPAVTLRDRRKQLAGDGVVLRTDDIRVQFGGITAVDGVSIEVRAGEVVGLIGNNGAGKSTLMNAIGGFVTATGTVELLGAAVNDATPARRAALGLGRGFQSAALFPELTVRETVLVATEARHRTGIWSGVVPMPSYVRRERQRRSEAEELLDVLGLGVWADTPIAHLSTGTRRVVELAGLLALDAAVLCLDEPTAGVARRDAEAFGPLILDLRREVGAAILLIEHDMPFVMGVSDRIYCLDSGRIIAEGTPNAVSSDGQVIASYLGQDA